MPLSTMPSFTRYNGPLQGPLEVRGPSKRMGTWPGEGGTRGGARGSTCSSGACSLGQGYIWGVANFL
jgi:hypothetical protein